MTKRQDSAALRWLIGGELARFREQRGLSMTDVAAESGLTKTKLNHLENARTYQSADDIKEILEVCGAPKPDVERLVSLAPQPHGKPWWNRWRSVVSEWFGLYLGLEGMASTVFLFEAAAIHGLLQTTKYAKYVTSRSNLVRPDDIELMTELRMSRAERLTSEPTLECHVVMDQAALVRRIPNKETLKDQYDHLLAISELPKVTLQVLETERDMHSAIAMGNYAILDFDGLNSVAYSELYGDALFVRDQDKVRSYRAAADHVSGLALTPVETRDLIRSLRKKL